MNFELTPGELMIVAGPVGSGKSSLLHAIMNETNKTGGSHVVRGRIAYVEQEPFIFSASIIDNVCFGLDYDKARFDVALKASQLFKDMENFVKGEETVIGERGVNISGGQKARISLARAIYSDADIYLLDDPLSAVDP